MILPTKYHVKLYYRVKSLSAKHSLLVTQKHIKGTNLEKKIDSCKVKNLKIKLVRNNLDKLMKCKKINMDRSSNAL